MTVKKLKVVLLGNTSVGKSSFANLVKYGYFTTDMSPTVGCEFCTLDYASKTPGIPDVKWMIWDTAGQEIFQSFTPQFCRGASLAMVFYDITDPKTGESVDDWIKMLDYQDPTGTMCEVIVVPTKLDIYDGKLDEESLMVATSEKRPVHHARPISSKTYTNIDVLLEQMMIVSKFLPSICEVGIVQVDRVEVIPQSKRCCCI
jgi:small GTP-binding protein